MATWQIVAPACYHLCCGNPDLGDIMLRKWGLVDGAVQERQLLRPCAALLVMLSSIMSCRGPGTLSSLTSP